MRVLYISVGGVGLLCRRKLRAEYGELDRESEGDLERDLCRGERDPERLLSDVFLLPLLGETDREPRRKLSESSSGDSLRKRLRTGLLTPFLFFTVFESSCTDVAGDDGGDSSINPCAISSSIFFLAAALFL